MDSSNNPRPLTVFYDGSCPLCVSEIGFYKRRRGANAIDWVDVSEMGGDIAEGLTCEAAMARFHVRTPSGELVDGGPAFAHVWRALPAFRWAGTIGLLPPFRWALSFGYTLFLPFRPFLQRLHAARAGRAI